MANMAGQNLKRLRLGRNLSQAALGKKIGYVASTICDIETGRRPISVRMAEELASYFNVPVKAFTQDIVSEASESGSTTRTLAAEVPTEVYAAIDNLANTKNTTKSALMRNIVARFVQAPDKFGMPVKKRYKLSILTPHDIEVESDNEHQAVADVVSQLGGSVVVHSVVEC